MNERLKMIRKQLGLNQKDMGEKINLSQTHISSLENGTREITDRIIHDLIRELNVSEHWLRTGEGEMFEQPKTFTLDEKAREHNLTDLEVEIMKNYMQLDKEVREEVLNMLKKSFENAASTNKERKKDFIIKRELSSYKEELLAEKNITTSSATPEQDERETS